MPDVGWLAKEANEIHLLFTSLFYGLVTLLLLLGLVLEYMRWPLGGMPSFGVLVGRALVAALLLHTFADVANLIGGFTDELSSRLLDFNQFNLVREKMAGKLESLSWSWLSVRESVLIVVSYLSFLLLHFSIYIADGFLMFTWVILYIFSPILIALFVLPATAPATVSLYRSLLEVGSWKIVWSVLGTLLWTTALSDIMKPENGISFLSAICYNLILAGSLLITPFIVHALAGVGISRVTREIGGLSVGGMRLLSMGKALQVGSRLSRGGIRVGTSSVNSVRERYFSKDSPKSASNKTWGANGASKAFKRKKKKEK